MKRKVILCGLIVVLLCRSLTGAQTLYIDLRKGIALFERTPNLWEVLPVLSTNLRGAPRFEVGITQVYRPPDTRYVLPFLPPVALRLENGLVITNREGYGDIALELPTEKTVFERIKRIASISLPWTFEEKALVIEDAEWLLFLPPYLNYLGKGNLIDQAMSRAKLGVFPLKIPLEDEPLQIEVRVGLSYPGWPVFARLQANQPLTRCLWLEGVNELRSLLDFRKDRPGLYTLTLFVEDIYGRTMTKEVPITISEFKVPVATQEITDKTTVGSRLLFTQRVSGVWNLWDTQIVGTRASLAFPFPGTFDILFTAPKIRIRYHIVVE